MNNFDENNFIKTILGALSKIQGVVLADDNLMSDLDSNGEKVKAQDFGIKYTFDDEGKCEVDLYLKVKFGVSILEIAWEAQTSVKEALSKSGVLVEKVHIHVEGVK